MINLILKNKHSCTPRPAGSRSGPGWFCCLVLAGSLILACQPRFDKDLLEKLVRMEKPVYKGRPVSAETLAAIRLILHNYHGLQAQTKPAVGEKPTDDSRLAEKMGILYYRLGVDCLEIEQLQQDAGQIGQKDWAVDAAQGRSQDELLLYQSALAIRLMARGMYKDALLGLQSILPLFPQNERLCYYAGLCAANLGKACVTDEQAAARADWYEQAYTYYSHAVALEPDYPEALYALAVLLVFELERPEEAETALLKLLSLDNNHTQANFLLGALYYRQGRLEEALQQYQAAAAAAEDKALKQQAEENINKFKGALHGA
jgi:tetratricopeptide (TPR) repeat protein